MKRYLLCFFTLLLFVCGTSAQKQNPDSLLDVAQKLAYKNHFAEANHIMVNLMAKYDTNSDYATFYGALCSWMHKYDSSKAILRKEISRHPKNLDAYDALTDVESWTKEDSVLIIDCNKAMLIPKANKEAYLLKIAEAQKDMQKFPTAFKVVDSILSKTPGDTSAKSVQNDIFAAAAQKTADSLFDSALHSSYRRQFIPAEKIVRNLVLEYPNNSDYKILYARLLGYRRKADTSEILLREVIAKEPNNIEAYDAYADDELVTLKFKHSEELADTGIGLPVKGDRTALVITKASAEDNLTEYYAGEATLDTLVKKHPKNTEASDLYKLILAHLKQFKADSIYALALKEATNKAYDSAHTHLDTIIKWFPANVEYLMLQGRVFAYQTKYDTAITILNRCVKMAPHNMDAYDALTDAELWKRDFPATINDCDKALSDSMFLKYPSMVPKKQDTSMTSKAVLVRDSLRKDSTQKAIAKATALMLKGDSLRNDSIRRGLLFAPFVNRDSLMKDSAKRQLARDSDARKYYSVFMLKRAKALFSMLDYKACVNTLDTMRKVDSTNKEANNLLTEAKIKLLKNTIQLGYLLNVFNAAPFGPWDYWWIQYTRNILHCPVSAKITYGSIWGLPVGWRDGVQFELGAYPSITKTTSADATVAYSNNFAVFPQWQISGNITQKLPLGFEGSLGATYMHFIDVIDNPPTPPQDVWIFDPYIGYYFGIDKWQLSYRPYFVYKKPSIYVTHTAVLRHFFGNPDTWVSLYGTYGTSPFVDYYQINPIATKGEMIGVDYQTRLPHNWLIWPMVSWEYLDYYPPNDLVGNMFYFQIILTKRF